MRRVSVVGAGTIGASWAAIFLARGYEVAATDPAPQSEAFARRFIDNAWPTLEKLDWSCNGRRAPRRFSFHRDVGRGGQGRRVRAGERAGARGPQDRAAGDDRRRAAASDVVIASSSSGLLISRVTVKCKHPERCVIGHPFNPPHLIPLVEVVGGAKTSPHAIDTAMEFYRALGKHPIHIKKEVQRPRRQPPAGGAVARGHSSGRRGRGLGRRCRRRDRLWARPALGADGAASDLPSRRRRRRHDAFHVASRPARCRAGWTISASPS